MSTGRVDDEYLVDGALPHRLDDRGEIDAMKDDLMIGIRVAIWIVVVVTFMLWLTGCSTYHAQVGPWSEPVVTGKTGMPKRTDKSPWTEVGVCRFGPTNSYPVIAKETCI